MGAGTVPSGSAEPGPVACRITRHALPRHVASGGTWRLQEAAAALMPDTGLASPGAAAAGWLARRYQRGVLVNGGA